MRSISSMVVVPGIAPMVGINGNTIGNWLIDNVVFVVVVMIAITVLTFAITRKVRDALISFSLTLLGLLLLSLAAFRNELGEWVRVTFFGG